MLLIAIIAVGAGCADDAPLECVEVSAQCDPLYAPEFDQIFVRTLQPKCALEGGSCHSIEGAKAGLIFEDADTTYDLLLGLTDGDQRVIPFDINCSILSSRISTSRSSLLMPPGSPLSAAERCVIIQWINNGAER